MSTVSIRLNQGRLKQERLNQGGLKQRIQLFRSDATVRIQVSRSDATVRIRYRFCSAQPLVRSGRRVRSITAKHHGTILWPSPSGAGRTTRASRKTGRRGAASYASYWSRCPSQISGSHRATVACPRQWHSRRLFQVGRKRCCKCHRCTSRFPRPTRSLSRRPQSRRRAS